MINFSKNLLFFFNWQKFCFVFNQKGHFASLVRDHTNNLYFVLEAAHAKCNKNVKKSVAWKRFF